MTNKLDIYKTRVQQAFSKQAASYDKHAGLQAYAAGHSAELLSSLMLRSAVPDGAVLEIGCGTGLFSSKLLKLFPDRPIVCSDISDDMLDACRLRLASQAAYDDRVRFLNLDAEYLDEENKYAVIASSFALQWFFEPMEGLLRLCAALKPGGLLLFSLPGADSCPEWKAATDFLQIPFTRNPLPSTTELQKLAIRSGMEFRFNDHMVEETFVDARAMLRSLKELGANTQRHNLQLSCMQLRRLLAELDRQGKPLRTNYQVIAGYFRRCRA